MRSAAVGQQCPDCATADAGAGSRPRAAVGRGLAALPVVSYGLIALNVLLFIAQNASRDVESALVLWSPAVADGQFYRLFTSAFLHYGPMHLLFNMWALYVVGPALEGFLGRWRFSALYLLSALGGSVTVYLLAPLDTATAGASGAIFGLFGATAVVARRLRMDTGWVVGVIVINLIFTFSVPGISWQGHLGGLIVGTLVTLGYLGGAGHRRTQIQVVAGVATLVLFAVLIWWRTTELVA
ncbi:rhomboid family intramembrane serine protease [Mycobacterium sp. M1]|uniref:Rhomboid family intramembrane serine protease n=2 Tax=Mycolicibacter acidiphilus TaxID=2835306 RepID=A0ABS5RHF2_9MYCO|nr:rhomboid family intramembrane serine protease [Mycolicibacter acidiphilus]